MLNIWDHQTVVDHDTHYVFVSSVAHPLTFFTCLSRSVESLAARDPVVSAVVRGCRLYRKMKAGVRATGAPPTDPGAGMMTMEIVERRNASLKSINGSPTVRNTGGRRRLNRHPDPNKRVATKATQATKMR